MGSTVQSEPVGDGGDGNRSNNVPLPFWDMCTAELDRLVWSITRDDSLHNDLLQEALVFLWRSMQCHPGQTSSWYMQGCRFHLLDELRRGLSLDAPKRRHLSTSLAAEPETESGPEEFLAGEEILGLISAHDMFEELQHRLEPSEQEVLSCLADGFTVQEIANTLGVSHVAVIKRRQKIARVANHIGISF